MTLATNRAPSKEVNFSTALGHQRSRTPSVSIITFSGTLDELGGTWTPKDAKELPFERLLSRVF